MVALVFELLGLANFIAGLIYWHLDHNDLVHWLFFLLLSVIMYLNAARYDKESE